MRPTPPLLTLALLGACVPPGVAVTSGARSGGDEAAPSSGEPPASSGPVPRPARALGRAEAEAYGLALINRDRGLAGLTAVKPDPKASAAAARHVRDMVRNGFTAHWGTDGSVPELRYTEAGGEDLDLENVACFGDGTARQVDEDGPFDPVEIERFQAAFMGEKPPSDGHRRNILTATHTMVGLGYATAPGTRTVCVSQEFIDDYGTYGPLPRQAKAGDTLKVTGEIRAPASFGGIGLARIPLSRPMSAAELLATGSYTMASPFITYFPAGFKTPKRVQVDGKKFSLDLPLTGLPGPGIYLVEIFARFPGEKNRLSPVSLRTVVVP